jgi:hypothetical protein
MVKMPIYIGPSGGWNTHPSILKSLVKISRYSPEVSVLIIWQMHIVCSLEMAHAHVLDNVWMLCFYCIDPWPANKILDLAEAIYTKAIPLLLMNLDFRYTNPEKGRAIQSTFMTRLDNIIVEWETRREGFEKGTLGTM